MKLLPICPTRRGLAFLLALLPCCMGWMGAGWAQSPDLCKTVVRTILAAEPPADGRSPWQRPVPALGKASAGTISVDEEGWRAETKQNALDRLQGDYRAGQELLAAIGKLTDDRWTFVLHRFGASSLHLAEVVEGTASCKHFVFFEAPAGAAAHSIAAPPVVQSAEPFSFCYRETAYAGTVSGTPTFIVETDQNGPVELSFTPWRDGGWQRSCKVAIRFEDLFDVTDRFCRGVDCREMAEQALSLVRQVDGGPRTASQGADKQPDKPDVVKFKEMKELAPLDLRDARLPTFGGSVHSRFGSNFVEFPSNAALLPVVVGGETYLARIGRAAFGWREIPDYLFAAYRMVGHRLEPVAGLYIAKTRGKPVSATAD